MSNERARVGEQKYHLSQTVRICPNKFKNAIAVSVFAVEKENKVICPMRQIDWMDVTHTLVCVQISWCVYIAQCTQTISKITFHLKSAAVSENYLCFNWPASAIREQIDSNGYAKIYFRTFCVTVCLCVCMCIRIQSFNCNRLLL